MQAASAGFRPPRVWRARSEGPAHVGGLSYEGKSDTYKGSLGVDESIVKVRFCTILYTTSPLCIVSRQLHDEQLRVPQDDTPRRIHPDGCSAP